MDIAWTESAPHSYFRVVDYLLEKWTKKELHSLESNVDLLLEKISSINDLCPKSNLFGYRKCLVDKNISLVYDITNKTILIISIVDNRSQHPY